MEKGKDRSVGANYEKLHNNKNLLFGRTKNLNRRRTIEPIERRFDERSSLYYKIKGWERG